MASLVVSFSGPDQPGLVNAVSETVAAFGGSWLESRSAGLAGRFVGIVEVDIPDQAVEAASRALAGLDARGLRVAIEAGLPAGPTGGMDAPGPALRLELVGHDRPGIVRDVTQALTRQGVNIEELSSWLSSASFSGQPLFHVTARLTVPAGLDARGLRDGLEALAREIMVDISVAEESEPA
jgi:glycine cleavage system regulatory protein